MNREVKIAIVMSSMWIVVLILLFVKLSSERQEKDENLQYNDVIVKDTLTQEEKEAEVSLVKTRKID